MRSPLPYTPPVKPEPTEERRLQLVEEAGDVIEALQSETARTLLESLHHSPKTPSALARTTDTSIQAVCYHLDNLCETDLVQVVDRWYSSKGREMDVYAPSTHRLILDITTETDGSRANKQIERQFRRGEP